MQTKKTICIMLCILLFVLILPNFIFAAGTSRTWDEQTEENKSIRFKPQIEIPGMDKIFTNKTDEGYKIDGNTIGNFIKVVYNYALGIIGIIAAIVLMWGGFMWLTAGGSSERMSEAKSWITASLSGLILALTAYLILGTINPDLVSFKELDTASVMALGCCEQTKDKGTCSTAITEADCKNEWREGSHLCSKNKCLSPDEIKSNLCKEKNGLVLPEKEKDKCKDKCNSANFFYSSFSYKIDNVESFCCICDSCKDSKDGTSCGDPTGGKNSVCQGGKCLTCAIEKQSCSFNWCCEGTCCEDNGIFDIASCVKGIPTKGKFCK